MPKKDCSQNASAPLDPLDSLGPFAPNKNLKRYFPAEQGAEIPLRCNPSRPFEDPASQRITSSWWRAAWVTSIVIGFLTAIAPLLFPLFTLWLPTPAQIKALVYLGSLLSSVTILLRLLDKAAYAIRFRGKDLEAKQKPNAWLKKAGWWLFSLTILAGVLATLIAVFLPPFSPAAAHFFTSTVKTFVGRIPTNTLFIGLGSVVSGLLMLGYAWRILKRLGSTDLSASLQSLGAKLRQMDWKWKALISFVVLACISLIIIDLSSNFLFAIPDFQGITSRDLFVDGAIFTLASMGIHGFSQVVGVAGMDEVADLVEEVVPVEGDREKMAREGHKNNLVEQTTPAPETNADAAKKIMQTALGISAMPTEKRVKQTSATGSPSSKGSSNPPSLKQKVDSQAELLTTHGTPALHGNGGSGSDSEDAPELLLNT